MPAWSSDLLRRTAFALSAVAALAGPQARAATLADAQRSAYEAVAAKTILDLQPFRQQTDAALGNGKVLKFISLAPGANAWFLLILADKTGKAEVFHLQNSDPRGQKVALEPGPVLTLTSAGKSTTCAPWAGDPAPLAKARATRLPFAPLCGGRLYLRNPASGSRSWRESVTDFLRDNVWGGDTVVQFVKNNFYRDAFAETDAAASDAGAGAGASGPPPAAISKAFAAAPGIATDIGLGLSGTARGKMKMGAWYRVAGVPGIFASAIEPRALSPSALAGPGANRLDSVELQATDYLVAFDLSQFDLGFALGTDHPKVDWSPRPPASARPRGLPGPDGIGSWSPLVRLGMIGPGLSADAVASFAGGFKRYHGAFKWGPFASVNHGSHYGFVEQGVIFSKLQPSLSTLYVLDDGTVGMKSWTTSDDALLPRLRFARQNGVPLVEENAAGKPVPGAHVTQWGAGNWSGSAKAELRTLRAGACMVEQGEKKRFLVYGYFSTATPSALARVFLAYHCDYAMPLDMNAPELTYLAIYGHSSNRIHVEHLVPAMALSDQKGRNGAVLPRFLGFPDSRDFFYLTRKR